MSKQSKTKSATRLKRSGRRSESQMRKEIADAGGHLLEIDGFHDKATAQAKSNWLVVQRKGFLVLKGTGCILPHRYYQLKGVQGPARNQAHVASVEAFVDPETPRNASNSLRNDDGWPIRNEISHLCHCSLCCHPGHLLVEPRWRNWKRNYCGGCDCSLEVKCLQKFHPRQWWEEKLENGTLVNDMVERDRDAALQLVKRDLPKRMRVKILPKTHYAVEDQKKANLNKRRKRGRQHAKQRKAKRRKRELKESANVVVENKKNE